MNDYSRPVPSENLFLGPFQNGGISPPPPSIFLLATPPPPTAERKRRDDQLPIAAGFPLTYGGYNYGLLSALAFVAPSAIVADIAHATPEVVAPAVTYAGLRLAAPIAPLAVAAAPSREAVLTTIKLNPATPCPTVSTNAD